MQPGYWRPRRSTAPNVRQHTSQRRRASSTNPEEGLVNADAGETLDPDVAAEAARVRVHTEFLWMHCWSFAYDCSRTHATRPLHELILHAWAAAEIWCQWSPALMSLTQWVLSDRASLHTSMHLNVQVKELLQHRTGPTALAQQGLGGRNAVEVMGLQKVYTASNTK